MIQGARRLPVKNLTFRDDAFETLHTGESIVAFDRAQQPPCVDEGGTFVAKFPLLMQQKRPYMESVKTTHTVEGRKRRPETFFKDFRVGVPTVTELENIVTYIHNVNEKLDFQMKKAADVICRLADYRSALITNGITGELDVRGFEIPSPHSSKEPTHA